MLHSLMMLTCLRVPVASHWLPSLKVGLSLSLYKYIYIYIHTYVTFDELRLRAVDRGIVPCYFRLFLLDCIRGAEKLREPEEQDHGGPGGGGRDMGRKIQGDVLRFSFFDRIDLGHFRAVRLLSVSRVDFFRPDPVEGAKCVFRWKARQFLRPQSREKGRRQIHRTSALGRATT